MTRIPIACTLTADDTTTRVDEWRQFLNSNVVEVIRTDTSVRLRLEEGGDAILAGVDLSRREKSCCAFFEFRLVPLPDAVWLEIDAPPEAAAVLDGLANLRMA